MLQIPLSELKSWYHKHKEEIQRDFFTFLQFPSISTDQKYIKEIHRTANWLTAYLKKWGLEVEEWATPGHPVVFAQSTRAGAHAPTVLIYQHYDVQPVDPIDEWKHPPFEPTVIGNQVYARGASDNKGQCFYSMWAIRAFLELVGPKALNIKLFIEGEEESGEKGTLAILESRKKELQADFLLVVDLALPKAEQPAVTLGMRGIVALNLECRNASIDLHSGTHGGVALNPIRALTQVLGELWDEKGRVAVPGFYDQVHSLSQKERSRLDFEFDEENYKKTFGVKAFANEEGVNVLESNWLRPTLEINGIYGGYTGVGVKTVIPAKAHAKISCRLVPNQDPEKIQELIMAFIRARMPRGIEVLFDTSHGGAAAFRTPLDSTVAKEAMLAFEDVFGKRCHAIFEGASVPIAAELAAVSRAETALLGVGLADDAIHSPNEHFGLDRLETGFLVISRLLGRLCGKKQIASA